MKYLVVGSKELGFSSSKETVRMLEEIVMPSFDQLINLETEKKNLAEGLPMADKAFVFIAEAASNEQLHRMLRRLPMWGTLNWEITAFKTSPGKKSRQQDIIKEPEKMTA